MNAESDYEVDILIIGGGIAGCTAAIALADSYNVLVIDKWEEPCERIGECLAPAARRILRNLDLLEGLEKYNSLSQENYLRSNGVLSYWGSEQVYIADHLRNPDGCSWHIDRRAFETYMRESALKRSVNCIWNVKLYSSNYEKYFWQIKVKTNDRGLEEKFYTIKAGLVIDASGRQSHFARQVGVNRTPFDKLIAVWAVLPDPHQYPMSTISSDRSGWWYSAPLPKRKRIISFHTDSDLIDRIAVKSSNGFTRLIKTNREMAEILEKGGGEIKFYGAVAANSTRLNQVAGTQWVALGDAAMSFDPLSSQGMYNAMATAMQLAELIRKYDCILRPAPENVLYFNDKFVYLMDRIWEYYVKHKFIFYNEEKRWNDSVFWKRRHFAQTQLFKYKDKEPI